MSGQIKRNPIDPNLVIALGVLIISFAALFVYIRQASIMGEQTEILLEQTKSSAWPNLSIDVNRRFENNRISGYQVVLKNRGTGPAIVNEAAVRFKDKAVGNWSELYKAMNVPDSIPLQHFNDTVYDLIIAPNESFTIIDWSDNPALMDFIFKKTGDIVMTICYSSVYGDYWQVERTGIRTNLEKNMRRQVDGCSVGDVIFIE